MAQATPSTSDPVTAYVCTEQGADVVRAFAANAGCREPVLHGGGVSGAARLCGTEQRGGTVLTEIGNLPLPMACESVSEIHRTGSRVIVFGMQDDIGTYRAIRQAGALEYFAFPVDVADIIRALSEDAANEAAPVSDPALRIAVTGSNGGVGVSILAQNLAWISATARGAGRATALVDGDLDFGSAACDLNRDGTPGFREALAAPDRVDETFLKATMDRIGPNLSLYCGHGRAMADLDGAEAGLIRLLPRLSAEFRMTVLDAPRGMLLRHPEMLRQLHKLVLLVPAGYSGVHAASRLITLIRASAPDLAIVPVLSDLRQDAGLPRKDLARALEAEIAHVLPRADQHMLRAHRAGQPLAQHAPRAPYARAVQALWTSLAGPAPSARARRSLLRRGRA